MIERKLREEYGYTDETMTDEQKKFIKYLCCDEGKFDCGYDQDNNTILDQETGEPISYESALDNYVDVWFTNEFENLGQFNPEDQRSNYGYAMDLIKDAMRLFPNHESLMSIFGDDIQTWSSLGESIDDSEILATLSYDQKKHIVELSRKEEEESGGEIYSSYLGSFISDDELARTLDKKWVLTYEPFYGRFTVWMLNDDGSEYGEFIFFHGTEKKYLPGVDFHTEDTTLFGEDWESSRFYYADNNDEYVVNPTTKYFSTPRGYRIPTAAILVDRGNYKDVLAGNERAIQDVETFFRDHTRNRNAVIHNYWVKHKKNEVPTTTLGEVLEEAADRLNPDLWGEDKELLPEVREKIVEIVDRFKNSLEEDGIKLDVKDIVLVGSNANYNYSPDSDIDVHIVANMDAYKGQEDLAEKLYNAYKSMFNNKYDPTIRGHEAEVYVEPDKLNVHSNGMYSLDSGWISIPQKEVIPDIDVTDQLKPWIDRYNDIMNNPTVDSIDNLRGDIHLLRQKSILEDGEYGEGNLVFKAFRNGGYMQRLKDKKVELINKEMSLESLNRDDSKSLNEARWFDTRVNLGYTTDRNQSAEDQFNSDYNYIETNLNDKAEIIDSYCDGNEGYLELRMVNDPAEVEDLFNELSDQDASNTAQLGESFSTNVLIDLYWDQPESQERADEIQLVYDSIRNDPILKDNVFSYDSNSSRHDAFIRLFFEGRDSDYSEVMQHINSIPISAVATLGESRKVVNEEYRVWPMIELYWGSDNNTPKEDIDKEYNDALDFFDKPEYDLLDYYNDDIGTYIRVAYVGPIDNYVSIINQLKAANINATLGESKLREDMDLNPLTHTETDAEYIKEICNMRADDNDWYVLHYNPDTAEYLNDIEFSDLHTAYEKYNAETPVGEDDRVELIFSPQEDDMTYTDNVVIANKGRSSNHDYQMNIDLSTIILGENLCEDININTDSLTGSDPDRDYTVNFRQDVYDHLCDDYSDSELENSFDEETAEEIKYALENNFTQEDLQSVIDNAALDMLWGSDMDNVFGMESTFINTEIEKIYNEKYKNNMNVSLGECLSEDMSDEYLGDLKRLWDYVCMDTIDGESNEFYNAKARQIQYFDRYVEKIEQKDPDYNLIPLAYTTLGAEDTFEMQASYNIHDQAVEYEVTGWDDYNGEKDLKKTTPMSINEFFDWIAEEDSWENLFDTCYYECSKLLSDNCDIDPDNPEDDPRTTAELGEQL